MSHEEMWKELRQDLIRRVSSTASCAIDSTDVRYYDGALDAYKAVLKIMTEKGSA